LPVEIDLDSPDQGPIPENENLHHRLGCRRLPSSLNKKRGRPHKRSKRKEDSSYYAVKRQATLKEREKRKKAYQRAFTLRGSHHKDQDYVQEKAFARKRRMKTGTEVHGPQRRIAKKFGCYDRERDVFVPLSRPKHIPWERRPVGPRAEEKVDTAVDVDLVLRDFKKIGRVPVVAAEKVGQVCEKLREYSGVYGKRASRKLISILLKRANKDVENPGWYNDEADYLDYSEFSNSPHYGYFWSITRADHVYEVWRVRRMEPATPRMFQYVLWHVCYDMDCEHIDQQIMMMRANKDVLNPGPSCKFAGLWVEAVADSHTLKSGRRPYCCKECGQCLGLVSSKDPTMQLYHPVEWEVKPVKGVHGANEVCKTQVTPLASTSVKELRRDQKNEKIQYTKTLKKISDTKPVETKKEEEKKPRLPPVIAAEGVVIQDPEDAREIAKLDYFVTNDPVHVEEVNVPPVPQPEEVVVDRRTVNKASVQLSPKPVVTASFTFHAVQRRQMWWARYFIGLFVFYEYMVQHTGQIMEGVGFLTPLILVRFLYILLPFSLFLLNIFFLSIPLMLFGLVSSKYANWFITPLLTRYQTVLLVQLRRLRCFVVPYRLRYIPHIVTMLLCEQFPLGTREELRKNLHSRYESYSCLNIDASKAAELKEGTVLVALYLIMLRPNEEVRLEEPEAVKPLDLEKELPDVPIDKGKEPADSCSPDSSSGCTTPDIDYAAISDEEAKRLEEEFNQSHPHLSESSVSTAPAPSGGV